MADEKGSDAILGSGDATSVTSAANYPPVMTDRRNQFHRRFNLVELTDECLIKLKQFFDWFGSFGLNSIWKLGPTLESDMQIPLSFPPEVTKPKTIRNIL